MPPRPVTTPRKRPHQARAQETVDALLEATARVLMTEGYDRASTNKIARTAGVSIGSLYQYFPSKEALVAALIDRLVERQSAAVGDKLVEIAAAPLEQAARELVRAGIVAHQVDPRLQRVLFEQVPRLGRLKKLTELNRRFEALLAKYLEQRRAELRPRDLELAAFVLCNAVDGFMHLAMLDRPELLRDPRLVDELTDLIVLYLAKDPALSARR
jgi:AcrR family transcriptional regulator